MAKEKTAVDVELARIKADLERSRLICSTISYCVAFASAVACIGIIAWAAVQITDKPAWLEIALAIVGLGGAPSLLTWRLYVRLKHRTSTASIDDKDKGDATR